MPVARVHRTAVVGGGVPPPDFSVLPAAASVRLYGWSSLLQMEVRTVRDIESIRSRSLRERAKRGRLNAFYSPDDDVLYVLPDNVMASCGCFCSKNHVDRCVLNAVVTGGGLERLFPSPAEHASVMSGILHSSGIPARIRMEAAALKSDVEGYDASAVRCCSHVLERMSEFPSSHCSRFASDVRRAVFGSSSLVSFGVSPGCCSTGDFWDHMVRFRYVIERGRALEGRDEASVREDMFRIIGECVSDGRAWGRVIDLGFVSPELAAAGLPGARVRIDAARFLSKMSQHKYSVQDIRNMDFVGHLFHPLCVMRAWSRDEKSRGRLAVFSDLVIEDRENGRPGILSFILPSREELGRMRLQGQNWVDLVSFHPRMLEYPLGRIVECHERGEGFLERNMLYAAPDFGRRLAACIGDYEKAMRAAGSVRFLLGGAHLIDAVKVVQEIGKSKFSGQEFVRRSEFGVSSVVWSGIRDKTGGCRL